MRRSDVSPNDNAVGPRRAESPKTPKSAATRTRLLQTASELFIERGYHAVSLQDIATSAGLSKGGVQGHFPSKGALLVEVIRWKLAVSDQRLDSVEDAEQADDRAALLLDPAARDVRVLELDAAAAVRHDPDVAEGMLELFEARDAAIREHLRGVPDPERVLYLIHTISRGVAMNEALGLEPPSAVDWTATLRRAVTPDP